MTDERCVDCGNTFKPTGVGTGYGVVKQEGVEVKVCYECCGKRDAKDMEDTGKTVLYLTSTVKHPTEREYELGYRDTKVYTVTNWPGTLAFKVFMSKEGHHNFAGSRTDVWFRGPDGKLWWGVQYGDTTQLVHCKRLKSKVPA